MRVVGSGGADDIRGQPRQIAPPAAVRRIKRVNDNIAAPGRSGQRVGIERITADTFHVGCARGTVPSAGEAPHLPAVAHKCIDRSPAKSPFSAQNQDLTRHLILLVSIQLFLGQIYPFVFGFKLP